MSTSGLHDSFVAVRGCDELLSALLFFVLQLVSAADELSDQPESMFSF